MSHAATPPPPLSIVIIIRRWWFGISTGGVPKVPRFHRGGFWQSDTMCQWWYGDTETVTDLGKSVLKVLRSYFLEHFEDKAARIKIRENTDKTKNTKIQEANEEKQISTKSWVSDCVGKKLARKEKEKLRSEVKQQLVNLTMMRSSLNNFTPTLMIHSLKMLRPSSMFSLVDQARTGGFGRNILHRFSE